MRGKKMRGASRAAGTLRNNRQFSHCSIERCLIQI
jgi:hypothetical protein